MPQELKITKEKVLEAASKCSTAKETLKTLFPEAFTPEDNLAIKKGAFIEGKDELLNNFSAKAGLEIGSIQIASGSSESGKTYRQLYFNGKYRWEFKERIGGGYLLTPYIR